MEICFRTGPVAKGLRIYGVDCLCRNKQAEMLLQMKVNLQPLDRHGNTPLHLAAGRGHELVLNTLLAAGAPWNAVGNGGATPLHCAAVSGYSSCLSRWVRTTLFSPASAFILNCVYACREVTLNLVLFKLRYFFIVLSMHPVVGFELIVHNARSHLS